MPKEPEIISIDEGDEDEPMEDEEVYEDEEELEEEEGDENGESIDEDEEMDETDRFFGNGATDNGSAFPVLEPSLKSVMGVSNKFQGS